MTNSYLTRRPEIGPISSADIYAQSSPFFASPYSWHPFSTPTPHHFYADERQLQSLEPVRPQPRPQAFAPAPSPPTPPPPTSSAFPGGTILHKGFFDLLALIPTTTASQIGSRFWSAPNAAEASKPPQDMAGPRYEEISPGPPPKVAPTTRPQNAKPVVPAPTPIARKGRRISKDMVGSPTNFVHLVHASDADQAEVLLTRWGPDGMGKLGDPRWAMPLKNYIRNRAQSKAVAEVVAALKPTRSQMAAIAEVETTLNPGSPVPWSFLPGPLRVVNGMPTPTSTTITTNSASPNTPGPVHIDGLPSPRGPGWPGFDGPYSIPPNQRQQPLPAHAEHPLEHQAAQVAGPAEPNPSVISSSEDHPPPPPPKPKPINPSLSTLEKAAAARIYFENLYFPLMRQIPSREQRRLAMEKEMDQMGLVEERKQQLRQRWQRNETEYLRERRKKVDPSAFKVLKTIGHGAFGVVSLVKEKSTGELYAMKQMRKTDMLRKGQEGHVRAERDVLKSAALVSQPGGAEWIVRLIYSFQDRDNLYLVLEYMGGGDLLNLLIELDTFNEGFTKFYMAEMILAVEQCHKQGFIHRDIKPDNFLFDPEGHIKLSDFGLATDLHWAHDTSYYEQQRRDLLHKHGIDLADSNGIADGTKTKRMNRKDIERIMGGGDGEGGLFTWREKNRKKLAYSICGTNSYMCPEVIRGQGYTFTCDWWSLGVIMYECLYGHPPFMSNSRHITRQKILNWKQTLRFPPKPPVSREAIDFMQKLLCEPEERLGSQALTPATRNNSVRGRSSGFMSFQGNRGSIDGAEYLKAHPWFKGIDWANIHKRSAPFKPNLQSPEDTRHFDDDIPAEPLAPANGAPADATRDPLLRDKIHGDHILDVRKALAFAGFTHKSPRPMNYARIDSIYRDDEAQERGRDTIRRFPTMGRSRALSM